MVGVTLLALLSFFAKDACAVPKNRGGGSGSVKAQTLQQQAAAIPQGISQATDGSTIMDTNATVNGLNLRFRISAPADQFATTTGIQGATQQAGAQGAMGLNVLLHGDGGQSFFDFPNQAVQAGLMGVVILAPSEQLLWGQSTGQPQGLERPDGVAHSQAVNDLVQQVLPQMVAFNSSNVFFTGVSGGSLTLSGFFVPAHMASFAGTGVLLMCGGLAPQVEFVNASQVVSTTKIHFQSSQDDLAELQQSIPQSISAFEQLATDAGLSAQQVGALQTADNTPNGGHCEFDGAGFSSGIQLVSNSFASIMQGGNGTVPGIPTDTVLKSVVGQTLTFSGSGT
ncbi:hypothetical protein M406DRAFT_71808 [Cryphonectria parasitica EP155]|uniref:Cyclin-like f-box protein n=1 Tax=Cryphonectria parasitica (strain ATCC 38755 / EP155) TaxID=660469 RepID=A0A9P4Y9D1_CRYP1|nr:uncharacterized protein M406DRAFT_71808 [Cryphonectria parasitica EP155]KAF3768835.1 hypothetical protein M406DRAFT_71808 [Cryphonectria parasitica EP155]